MISPKFLYSPFLITLFIIVFCIISITYIHAFNGIYYMNSCAIIVKNQAITQVFQLLLSALNAASEPKAKELIRYCLPD